MKKIYCCIIIFVLVIFMVAVALLYSYLNNMGQEVYDDDRLQCVYSTMKKYNASKISCSIEKKEDLYWLYKKNYIGRSIVEQMTSNDYVINTSFISKFGYNRESPVEIYAIFESFIELKHKRLLDNIVAIECSYQNTSIDYDIYTIIISQEEFIQLYNNTDIIGKTNRELAKEIGDLWSKKFHYNMKGLNLSVNEAYRQYLITPWSMTKVSLDTNYSARYFYDTFKLKIYNIEHGESGEATIISTIITLPILESGFMYGAWDNNNNIWLYGETTGLQVCLHNDGIWEAPVEGNLEDAPPWVKEAFGESV